MCDFLRVFCECLNEGLFRFLYGFLVAYFVFIYYIFCSTFHSFFSGPHLTTKPSSAACFWAPFRPCVRNRQETLAPASLAFSTAARPQRDPHFLRVPRCVCQSRVAELNTQIFICFILLVYLYRYSPPIFVVGLKFLALIML